MAICSVMNVILTERSGGRIPRRDFAYNFARCFTLFSMTRKCCTIALKRDQEM